MRRRKNNKYLLLLSLLLLITMGYALVSTQLKMIGISNVDKQTWNVYWGVPTVTSGSVSDVAPTRGQDQNDPANTKLTWSVTLNLPGDYYEFTVDAVNEGSLDAMIIGIDKTVTPALPEYIKYKITYVNNVGVIENQILPKATVNGNETIPTTQTYKIRVYYDENEATATTINDMTVNTTYTFEFGITYGQATDDAIAVHAASLGLGDYFTLVPDETIATTSYAGFSGSTPTADQTLWRVIDIHQDGTLDAVSEYVSTDSITIAGIDGYKNAIAGLQDIASKYAKSGYTVGTRMFGYDGQTLVLSDTSAFDGTNDPTSLLSPDDSQLPTTGTGEEYGGGVLGDTLYLKDYLLVTNIYSNEPEIYTSTGLRGYTKEGAVRSYWVASRTYDIGYQPSASRFSFTFRVKDIACQDGLEGRAWLADGAYIRSYDYDASRSRAPGWWKEPSSPYYERVRPIITLRSGVVITDGAGVKDYPFEFE